MENGHFEFQIFEGAVGTEIRESFGELLGRGVGWEGFYWVGSGRAKSFSYRVQAIRIPSQNGDSKISIRGVCEYSTYACAACRSLTRSFVNASFRTMRLLWMWLGGDISCIRSDS